MFSQDDPMAVSVPEEIPSQSHNNEDDSSRTSLSTSTIEESTTIVSPVPIRREPESEVEGVVVSPREILAARFSGQELRLDDYYLTVNEACCRIQRKTHLESLVLDLTQINGLLGQIAAPLAGCIYLKKIHMISEGGDGSSLREWNDIGQVLARLPRLEEIILQGVPQAWNLLLCIFQSRSDCSLRTIRISACGAAPKESETDAFDSYMEFLEECQASRTLQCLDLQQSLEVKQIKFICSWLRQPDCCLETLELTTSVRPLMRRLLKALRDNQSVRQFTCEITYFRTGKVVEETHEEEVGLLYEILEYYNYALTEVVINPWKAPKNLIYLGDRWNRIPRFPKRWEDEDVSEEFRQRIEGIFFFLELNRAGRGRLMGPEATPTKKEWVETIVHHKADLSTVFYYLTKQPTLVHWYALGLDKLDTANQTRNRKRKYAVWV